MRRRSSTYVGIAAFPLAVYALHQLRYLLAYGAHTEQALQDQGHAYMGLLGPLLVVAVASGVGGYLGKLADHWRGMALERSVRTGRLWLAAAAALLAVYATQETIEGLLATGHPAGLKGIFGDGGLWSIPLAAILGGGLALLMRGGQRVAHAVAGLARRLRRPRLRVAPTPILALLSRTIVAPRAPIARRIAGRGPPMSAVSSSSLFTP